MVRKRFHIRNFGLDPTEKSERPDGQGRCERTLDGGMFHIIPLRSLRLTVSNQSTFILYLQQNTICSWFQELTLCLVNLCSGDFPQVAHVFSACLQSLSCSFSAEGPKWLQGSLSIVSHKILKPIFFPGLSPSPVHTHHRAGRNALLSPVNNDNKKHQQKPKCQTRLVSSPGHTMPLLTSMLTQPLRPNPKCAPLPGQECCRIVTFSPHRPTLVSQED